MVERSEFRGSRFVVGVVCGLGGSFVVGEEVTEGSGGEQRGTELQRV
jgi:hypothetical protein